MMYSHELQTEAAALYLLSDGRKRISETLNSLHLESSGAFKHKEREMQIRYEHTKQACLRYAELFRECRQRIESLSTARVRID